MKRARLASVGRVLRQVLLLVVGTTISALGYSLFQVPYNIAAGGVSGIGIIVNHFTGWPIGTFYLVMNVPLLILGFFNLGGLRFLWRTILAVLLFSSLVDLFNAQLPRLLTRFPVTDDVLLSAIYGGIVGGIGIGLIYRSGGTIGGTSILGRILQKRTGAPLSQLYFYTDGVIILTAGLVFGWEIALYALLTMFLNGLASDYVLEGVSNVRTATIITDRPEEIAQAIIAQLGRGVSFWPVTGAYTGRPHTMLLCTIYRSQLNPLKQLVAELDRDAFVIVGKTHQALGFGFPPLR